jgi:hypothetical protein
MSLQVKVEPMDDVECHRDVTDVIKTEPADDVTLAPVVHDDVEEPTNNLVFGNIDIVST